MKDTTAVELDLDTARERYLAEQAKDYPSAFVKFTYAKALARDAKPENKQRGIGLLQDLLNEDYMNKTDCLYCLALAYYDLGEFSKCRKQCEVLLRINPTHEKALSLHQSAKDHVNRDGCIGLGLAAGAVMIAGLALKLLLKHRDH
ncbi:hypothetical protein SPRG_09980 [Saprolegnia parasitica CBS 223.65]|uniref:Mitochondrial fission 1 protein n=1 Tax=Saprolegnia parasitica (strain CBS 223.65) TaxID=695850 RepID=A0A067C8S7_SAPPC|nr:hypothetical protein SPRG_09980 [Saprolegnia parasitica CBS 223.65]KDO23172.1 hypothetical protein SPRG_09980 [Saprolegnia parasitica CBS 223.65]|eukprot:XP_012206124.1 hypothetical protein SPRG_09980 [Saprolegnia parasitica CBS 223.65]